MNAILRSTTVATLLAMTALSTGCGMVHATKPAPVDDAQAYVDGTINPVTASIDQSLQTLVILERGDEGPRKNGAIGDTVAGGSPARAPRTVALAPPPAAPVVKPVSEVPVSSGKELARLEHGSDSDKAGCDKAPKAPCSDPTLLNDKSSYESASVPPGMLHSRGEVLHTDPSRRPAEAATPQDGGADASRAVAAARASLNTRVRLNWEGTPDSLVSQVAHAIGFNVQTEGRLEGLKVSVHEDDATVETVLRDAARQIDGKADIQVDTSSRTIWLVAVHRR